MIPHPNNRREICRWNLRLFCETYLGPWFHGEWSPGQARAVCKIEDAVLLGDFEEVPMGRGEGKTTLTIAATLWVKAYNHCRFAVLIAMTARRAADLLNNAQHQCGYSKAMARDFPQLEGRIERSGGTLLEAVSIDGCFRGMQRRVDGETIRPELVIVDDPFGFHTWRELMRREHVLSHHVQALGGAARKISGVVFRTAEA